MFLYSVLLTLVSTAQASPIVYTSPDVFIRYVDAGQKRQILQSKPPTDLADCRAKISQAICWVDPVDDTNNKQVNLEERPCLKGGEKFVGPFFAHFDKSPDFVKRMYCHIDKIWIEKSFSATAYASPIYDADGNMVGAGIGVREELFGNAAKFDDWISWKEETSFGGSLNSSDPRMGLIQYSSNKNTKEFFFDYVVNHEFGHLFDFANKLNQTTDCEYKETKPGNWERVGTCRPLAKSWGEMSWSDVDNPKPSADFPLRSQACYYFCNGKFIDPQNADALFQGLVSSPFVSVYAATNPLDDFAEAFAMALSHQQYGFNYQVAANNKVFNLTEHFESTRMAQKLEYIKVFTQGPIQYP